jgi:hypothetical protein
MGKNTLAAQKAMEKKQQQKYTTFFLNGKQKRIKSVSMIDGMDADEFILRNADPLVLHQNEMWEYIGLSDDGEIIGGDVNADEM